MPNKPMTYPTDLANPFNVRYGRFNQAIISGLGATRTLLEEESGSLILLDRAAGIVVTLPPVSVGYVFDFIVTVSVTTNAYKIITSAGTIFLVGQVLSNDTDTSGAAVFFAFNGSTHIAYSADGITKGGLIGTRLRFTCITATLWLVEGVNNGSGTVATPASTT